MGWRADARKDTGPLRVQESSLEGVPEEVSSVNLKETSPFFACGALLTAARPGLFLETETRMTSRFPRFTVCLLAGTALFCPCTVILAQSSAPVSESQEGW